MESIYQLLDEFEDIIEERRTIFNRILIDKEVLFDILREIRMSLPKEIENAKWVIQERNRIVIEAQRETEELKEKVKEQLREAIDEHEITKGAEEKAMQIIEESKQHSRDMRIGALEYADEVLAQLENKVKATMDAMRRENTETEKFLNDTIDTIFQNRQELRGIKKP